MSKVVKNASKAYGYNYASLADILNQGYEAPKMRVKSTITADGQLFEFLEYLDENGEWQQGARVLAPAELEMKGMNACQKYGSALTYARRYTVLMALGLASDDDVKLENTAPAPAPRQWKKATKLDFDTISKEVAECSTADELNRLWKGKYADMSLSEKQKSIVLDIFRGKKELLKDAEGIQPNPTDEELNQAVEGGEND